MYKTIPSSVITKAQMMLVKAIHKDFTWDEVNKVLFELHQAQEIESTCPEPKHEDTWDKMQASSPSLGATE